MQFLKGQRIIIGNSHLLPSHFAHRIYTVAEIFIFIFSLFTETAAFFIERSEFENSILLSKYQK